MEYDETILITGVAGFIAAHVFRFLIEKYPNKFFVGIDKMSYCSNLKNVNLHHTNFDFRVLDILDTEGLQKLFKKHKFTKVLHFAAYTHVDSSFGNSLEFTKNNILGTHCLLEVSRQFTLQLFLHVSTDEVYGSQDAQSHEDSILQPTNPYAATKAAIEHIVRSYHISYKLPIIITRGNNVYGPMQHVEKLIPRFITLLNNNEQCTIQGKGDQIRSFLYVEDVAKAFDTIVEKGKIGETYNIGGSEEFSVLEVTHKLLDLIKPMDNKEKWITYVEDRNFNDVRYNINFEKIRSLGWNPEVSFEDGLKRTIRWYLSHPGYFDKIY